MTHGWLPPTPALSRCHSGCVRLWTVRHERVQMSRCASLAVLALVGCALDHPVYPECTSYVKPHQYTAELLWQARHVDAGLATTEEMRRWYPLIYWCSKPCDDPAYPYDRRVGVVGHSCYAGRVITHDGAIYLADWGLLADTALAHELTHATQLHVLGETWEPRDDAWWAASYAFDRELDERGW